MLFIRHDNNKGRKILRTNAERCAQISSIIGTILIIIAGILLYFAITTDFSEQKSVYFMLFFVTVISLFVLIGICIYCVRKLIKQDELHPPYHTHNGVNYHIRPIHVPRQTSSSSNHINQVSSQTRLNMVLTEDKETTINGLYKM